MAAGLVAAGSVFLAAATGLAIFSQIWASTTPLPRNDTLGAPGTTVWLSVGVGVLVGAATARALLRRSWGLAVCVALGGVFAMIALAVLPHSLLSDYKDLTTKYSAAQQVPTAFAAWLLVCAGVVAIFAGAWVLLGWPRLTRAAFGTGAVVGVVIALVVAALFLRDADPNRNFDASTAATIPIPAVPNTLGASERFSVRIEVPRQVGSKITDTVRGAGPGFVVRTSNGVRAFDSAGHERWHHLHTDEWSVSDMHVFDDGATVVARFAPDGGRFGVAVGLDAMTGQVLWRSADHEITSAVAGMGADSGLSANEPLYLVVPGESTLTRIDTRTGRKLWSVGVPDDYSSVDSEAGVGYFTGAENNGRTDVHYVSLDPQTGNARFDVVAATYRVAEEDTYASNHVRAVKQAGRNGVVFTTRADGGTHYLNALTGQVFPFDGDLLFSTVATDDFVASEHSFQPNTPSINAIREQPDGRVRCPLPEGVVVGPTDWLADEVIYADRAGLIAYRRSDCSEVPAAGPRVPTGDLTAVPGVVLVADLNPASLVIRGYA
ncbi:hypothetical protein MMAG44476_31516 [Mycolicibacterium mageritense DSM 44476 = CIP 104973]|uniref:Pyrrolo-quinoline quinone repeat domain-containing protein n=1 Tax=Mycolicibacterium mageritense TaxID=53462 RepID=A0ABM7HWG4_MYCME|nr:hypothetical protein MMAGJ_42260 [Mycolicibacterium mageritense]CDO20539.1 hypothetical protein BN978_00993 [Mycolicibacterium mageritense DSM 44476 = CIP 104973]